MSYRVAVTETWTYPENPTQPLGTSPPREGSKEVYAQEFEHLDVSAVVAFLNRKGAE